MKAPAVPMPRSLRNMRKDRRGFPIPYIVAWIDQRPAFAVVDPLKWDRCAYKGRCALCGETLPGFSIRGPEARARAWFIGGDLCAINRLFYDPGMCEGCARYALMACPYLAMTGYQRYAVKPDPAKGYAEAVPVAPDKPKRFMLGLSDGWQVVRYQESPLVHANEWQQLEWWSDGKRVE